MKWIVFAVGLSSLSLVSCRAESPPVSTSLQSAPATVTQLEPPTLIESTKLETSSNPSTTTTITPVQQAITDLKAQRTPEGLRINLPENILFDFDKSEIQPNAKPTLQKLSILLKNYKNAPTEMQR
jgi:outer membrane protein OmpA-like peptidoglycan-associated protein